MEVEGAPAFAVIDPVNIAYLTGFERVFDDERAHVALVTPEKTILFTDSRYSEAATAAAQGGSWVVERVSNDLVTGLCETLAREHIDRLALEDTVAIRQFDSIAATFAGEVVKAKDWTEKLRAVKEPEEIERIARAQELTDRAFEHVLDMIKPGVTERDVALEIEFFMRRNGSDGIAFAPIVAAGPNSSLPHAKVTDRAVEPGELLKMDFGARVEGYCADMTRTVVVGRADGRTRDIYDAVRAANEAGIEAVRAGKPGREIDAAARAVIEAAGFGELFSHGLGHGVGREVHELPGVGPRSEDDVPAGSVITIEPGVYVPGFGGVRIEDLVVVENEGARVLTRTAKDLIEL
jgi:Xaa-Pro aminopeptidase